MMATIKKPLKVAKEPLGVDEFIDYGSDIISSKRVENEDYARWVLNHFRLSAICKMAFAPFMAEHKLFATYQGAKYRVTGASRMGDVWLARDFERTTGYDLRVCVADLSKWEKS